MTLDDLDLVLKIESQWAPEAWRREHFIEEMNRPYAHCFVMTDDETDAEVFGYIVFWAQAEGLSILNVAVDQHFRNMGIGTRLVQHVIRHAVHEDYPRIVLEVRESNAEAIALYKKCGFKKTHERRQFYQNGETALVLEVKTSEHQAGVQ